MDDGKRTKWLERASTGADAAFGAAGGLGLGLGSSVLFRGYPKIQAAVKGGFPLAGLAVGALAGSKLRRRERALVPDDRRRAGVLKSRLKEEAVAIPLMAAMSAAAHPTVVGLERGVKGLPLLAGLAGAVGTGALLGNARRKQILTGEKPSATSQALRVLPALAGAGLYARGKVFRQVMKGKGVSKLTKALYASPLAASLGMAGFGLAGINRRGNAAKEDLDRRMEIAHALRHK